MDDKVTYYIVNKDNLGRINFQKKGKKKVGSRQNRIKKSWMNLLNSKKLSDFFFIKPFETNLINRNFKGRRNELNIDYIRNNNKLQGWL